MGDDGFGVFGSGSYCQAEQVFPAMPIAAPEGDRVGVKGTTLSTLAGVTLVARGSTGLTLTWPSQKRKLPRCVWRGVFIPVLTMR